MVGGRANLFRAADRLIRTTAFRLTAVYLALFIVFATLVLGYAGWHARKLTEDRLTQQIEMEIETLAEQYRQGGERRLLNILERRGRRFGNALYLLADQKGDSLTGNILLRDRSIPELVPGWSELKFTWPDEAEDVSRPGRFRIFTLPSGSILLVGRDLAERDRLSDVFRRARSFSILMAIIIGAISAFFVTRRVLSRVDAIAGASQRIMAGNLAERLPVEGTNDEFDRLASHLNAMLDRMNGLMQGLRELSDNVAHDLRTPLTRLRASAEQALRGATTIDQAQRGLERAIEESDKLIQVFDQLQMIARAETGNLTAISGDIEVYQLLLDLEELYGPSAEEASMPLSVSASPGLMVRASRELLNRALANLIENALKYSSSPQAPRGIVLAAAEVGGMVEISVNDHGVGIPPHERDRVLERFVRLDQSRNAPGFGLGLSLVSAVARLMGGSLMLRDNSPGLSAVISLPKVGTGNLTIPIAHAGAHEEY